MDSQKLEQYYRTIEAYGISRMLIDAGSNNEISMGLAEELCSMIEEISAPQLNKT